MIKEQNDEHDLKVVSVLTPSSIKHHNPVIVNDGLKSMSDCYENAVFELGSDNFLDPAIMNKLVSINDCSLGAREKGGEQVYKLT